MTSLPDRPDLDQLRTQAKELKRALIAGELNALERVLASHPKYAGQPSDRLVAAGLTLRDAQVTVARELGFESWKALLAEVEGVGASRWQGRESDGISRRAFKEAMVLKNSFCTQDHFLLALLNPDLPTPAFEVLTELGLTHERIKERLSKMDRRRRSYQGSGSTPAYQLILGWAQGIAIGMGAMEVTDEHVLLALAYGGFGGESMLIWLEVDPDEVVSKLAARGVPTPHLQPPVAPTPTGPLGPWVYFPEADSRAVVQELVKHHPPGTALWGTNSSKWKKGYIYVHGEDQIRMEEIVRRAVPDKKLIQVLSFQEGMALESALAPRRYRQRPQADASRSGSTKSPAK